MKSDIYSNQKPYAIVLGIDSMTGLQAARVLAEHKIPIVAIAKDPTHYNCRTNVCEEILIADTSNDEMISLLEKIAPRFTQKPVLVPCEDWNVKNISRNRNKLQKDFVFMLPDPTVVDLVFNKEDFCAYAKTQGFKVPRTIIIMDRQDAEQASKMITYPCIMKPPGRTAQWEDHTRFKVYKAYDADELLDLYDRYHMYTDRLLVQEWVVGPDGNIFSCYCYFDKNSNPIVSFVARKIRQWPPETGMSCSAVECRNDDVLQQTIRLFTGLKHVGLAHLEMKRDERTGEHVMIEAHVGRPTGKSSIVEAGGVELLYSMYCDAIGLPFPKNIVQKYVGAKWIHMRRDFQSAFHYWRKGELTLAEWFRSTRGRKAQAVFSWSDPGPFIGDLYRSIRLLLHLEDRVE